VKRTELVRKAPLVSKKKLAGRGGLSRREFRASPPTDDPSEGARCRRTHCVREAADGDVVCSKHRIELDRNAARDAPKIIRIPRVARPVVGHSQQNASKRQSAWRKQVELLRFVYCVAFQLGDCQGQIECDHIKPKSTGCKDVWSPNNGAFLCTKHHKMKTDGTLQYRFEWLDAAQVAWLASVSWVRWDREGQPAGEGWRHFAPMTAEQTARHNRMKVDS
jgi:hypothetical protein